MPRPKRGQVTSERWRREAAEPGFRRSTPEIPDSEKPGPDREPTNRTVALTLLGILGGGLLIRLVHFWAIARTAFPQLQIIFDESDMHTFWRWAQTILAGDILCRDTYHPYFSWMREMAPLETWYRWWGGKEIFQQAPLYPYFLAGLLALRRDSVTWVLLVQLILGALQPLVMYGLARRLFADVRIALVAALFTALYGPFIFHQGTLLRDWLPPLLEPWALLLLLRAQGGSRGRDWALAGAALGLALLTKETILLFLPLVLLWVIWEHRGALRRALPAMACLLGGILLLVSPLLVRNALVGAPVFSLSQRAAEAFIMGNVADATPVGLPGFPPSMKGILERTEGRLTAVVRETLATYQGDWLRFMQLQFYKLRAIVDPSEVPNNLAYSYGLEISPVLRLTLGYGLVLPLGLAGLALSLTEWRRHVLLLLYGSTMFGALMFSSIVARYRMVLVPVLILYGASGIVRWGRALRGRRPAPAIGYLALVAGFALAQHRLLALPEWRVESAVHLQEYNLSAKVYADAGQYDRAVAEMERLAGRAREQGVLADIVADASLRQGDFRVMWARQLLEQGKREEARRQVELTEKAYADHMLLSRPHYYLGLLYLRLGETAKARVFLTSFLMLEPVGVRADQVRQILARLDG